MKRIPVSILLLLSAACGVDHAVVGGRCREGWEPSDGRCVPTADPASPANVVEADENVTTAANDEPAYDETWISRAKKNVPSLEEKPLVCAAPLVACRDTCITVDSDPLNCGACGKICPSNICVAGECQGATPGDVVVIGHDFAPVWSGSSQAKVLRNALSIPTTDPIRVLAYEGRAPEPAVTRIRELGTVPGRSVSYTQGDATALESSTLAQSYDVVLVHDGAPQDDPSGVGARWVTSLDKFTKKGGVVIAIAGGASDMTALLAGATLLPATTPVSFAASTHLAVSAPADVVGAQVLSPYATAGSSIGFSGLGPATDTTWVVRQKTSDDSGLPIVIHRLVR